MGEEPLTRRERPKAEEFLEAEDDLGGWSPIAGCFM